MGRKVNVQSVTKLAYSCEQRECVLICQEKDSVPNLTIATFFFPKTKEKFHTEGCVSPKDSRYKLSLEKKYYM